MEGQLRQKDDMGDALHYIDFHQLQIENKQYVTRIEERNDELLKVRMSACGISLSFANAHYISRRLLTGLLTGLGLRYSGQCGLTDRLCNAWAQQCKW